MNTEKILTAAEGYRAGMSAFLRGMIPYPDEICDEKDRKAHRVGRNLQYLHPGRRSGMVIVMKEIISTAIGTYSHAAKAGLVYIVIRLHAES